MHATTYLLAALAALPTFAAPNPSPVEQRDVASTTISLSGAQSSAVFAAWYLYAMTLPASNPTLQSLVHYVATAVPTTDYTYTPSPLPTSWDLAGYLNAPPAPSFPAWLTDIPDTAARSSYSALIEQLESDSVSLGRLATAGTINGTLFPGIVPAKATGGAAAAAATTGQTQVTTPATVTATATTTMVSMGVSVSTTTTTKVGTASASAAAGVSSVSSVAVVSAAVSAVSTATTGTTTSAKTSVATYAPGANAAVSVGMSVGAVLVAGVAGVAALL